MKFLTAFWQKLKNDISNINYFGKMLLLIVVVLAFDLFMISYRSIFIVTNPLLAVALSWVWLLLPGFLISFVVADHISWWERIPVSFVLAIGLATPITIIAILLRLKLNSFISLHVSILLISAIVLIVHSRRIRQTHKNTPSDQKIIVGGLKRAITPLLVISIILAGTLIILAREWPLFGDEIAGLSIFSEVIQHEQITGTEPFHGTDVPVTPRNELIVWTYNAVLVDYISGTSPTEFFVHSRPILVAIALLSLATLLNQYLQDKFQALFFFCLWGIYLLATTQADRTGSDFVTRIIQDKFLGWFVVIPIVLVFALWFIKNENKSYLIGFGVVTFGASMVHPITLTQAMILTTGFGLIHFLFDRSRRTFINLLLIALVLLISTAIPFYQFVRFNDYSPVQLAGLGDAVEFGKLSSSVGRYRLWMLDNGRYILHPSVILEPVIIAAYVLLPWLILQVRKYYAPRLIVGTLLILPVLLYTPPFASLAGRVVTPYLIWRLAWPFPLFAVLTIGWALWSLAQKFGSWKNVSEKPQLMTNIIYPSVIILILFFAASNIKSGLTDYKERRADISLSTCITAKNVLSYLNELSQEKSVNVLASHDLNFCIPGYAALANVVEFRGYGTVNRLSEENLLDSLQRVEDVNYFNVAKYVDDLMLKAIVRHEIDYVLLEKERLELDFQFRYLTDYFHKVYEDADYSLYAVYKPVTSTKFIEANTALRSNQWEAAIQLYDQILQKEPTHVLALFGMGLAQAGLGHNDLSIMYLQEAIQYKPDEAILHADLANTYVFNEDIQSAIKEYQEATNLSPDRYTLYAGLGKIYILAGQQPEAKAIFEKATSLRRVKDTAAYYSALGRLYQAVNMNAEAIQYYEKAISIEADIVSYVDLARVKKISGDVDGAIKIYKQAESLDRWNYLPHLDLGYLYLNQDRLDESIEELEIACQLRPTNVSAYILLGQAIQKKSGFDAAINRLEELKNVSNVLPGPYRGIAALMVANGEYKNALEELGFSSNIQPKSAAILIAKGYISVANKQTDTALNDFNQALLYNPDLISARLGLSMLYVSESEYDLAASQFIQIVRLSPLTAWAHIDLARAYQQQGNWKLARKEIDLAIRLEPDNIEGYITRGELNKAQLFYDQAIADYLQALEIDPKNQKALIGLGDVYQEQANWTEAEKSYHLAVEADANSAYPKIKLLEIYWQQGRFEEVAALEDNVLKMVPSSDVGLIKLAMIFRMQGRFDEAKSIYENVIQSDPTKVAAYVVLAQLMVEGDNDQNILVPLYNDLLNANPESANAYLAVGQYLIGQGQLDLAEEVFQTALTISDVSVENYIALSELQQKRGERQSALSTLNTALDRFSGKAVVFNELGEYYLNAGQVDNAETYFTRALELDPSATSAYVGKSQIEQIKGDYTQAEKILQNAITRNSNSPQLLLAIASFQESIGRSDLAEESLIKAVELMPADINIQSTLGQFYMRRHRYAEALSIFQEALQLPGSKLEIYLDLGDLYLSETSPDEAIEWYQTASSTDQSDIRPYLALADLYQSMNNREKALETLQQALVIEPANLEVNLALGELYQKLGQVDDAITYLKRANTFDHSQTKSLIALAQISRDNGNLEQAINYLEQAIEISPTHSPAYAALAQVFLLVENQPRAEDTFSHGIQSTIDKQDAYLTRAAFYDQQGIRDLAQADYEKAWELFPYSRTVGLKYVDFLSRQNNLAQALQVLSDLEKRTGTDAGISAAYGAIYFSQAKWQEAGNAFQQAIDSDSTNKDGYLGLARISEVQGDIEGAISIYQTAVNNTSHNPEVLISLGDALLSQGKYMEAQAAFQDVLKLDFMNPTSLMKLEQLNSILQKPETNLLVYIQNALQAPSAEAFNTLARLYQYRGEWELAYSWLQKSISLEPYNSENWINIGNYYQTVGQWDKALEAYNQALKYYPASMEAWIATGFVQEELGFPEAAQESYQHAMEISPGRIDGYMALARLYFHLGKNEQSLATAREGITTNPGDYRGYQTLGDLYIGIDSKNYLQAEEAYREGLQVLPASPELYTRIADLYTEQLLALREKLDATQAIELLAQNRVEYLTDLQTTGLSRQQSRVTELKLEEAIRIYESYRVRAEQAQQEYKQASLYFETATTNYMNALNLQPNQELALIGMAKLQLARDSVEDAIVYFEEALTVDPHSTLSMSYLGSIYLKLGHPDEAIRFFEQILAYEPRNLFAQLGLSDAYHDLEVLDITQAAASVVQSQFKLQSLVENFRLNGSP